MKKAVAILVNDVHLDKSNGELVRDIFHQLQTLANKEGVTDIIIGGDVFTNRSGQPLTCLTTWKEIVDEMFEEEICLHIIPGNHDKTDADDERGYLDIYSHCCLYRSAQLVNIRGVEFVMVPYFKDEKWFDEWTRVDEQRSGDCPSILITHIGLDGVRNNDGSAVVSKLKPSLFSDYNKVLIGHYHNASRLGKNVFYTGSAYQNNFGENITDKGFTVIYDDGSTRFVPSHFPKYIKQTIAADDTESLKNLLENYEGETYDHIRFVFVGKKTDCQKINIAEIQGKYAIDCKFECNEEKEAIEISESDSVLCYDKKAVIKDFFKFCADEGIRGAEMKYGLELVKNI